MKRFFFLALFLAFAGFASAQAIIVTPSNTVSGTINGWVSNPDPLDLWIYLENNTGASAMMEWNRTSSYLVPGWVYTICDCNVCYFGDHQGAVGGPVAAGDSCYLKASVEADSGEYGSGYVDYSVWIQGDSAATSVQVTFLFNVLTTVDEVRREKVILLYPNPAAQELNMVSMNGMLDKGRLHIYDMSGRMMISKEVKGVASTTVDVTSLPVGNYMMRYNTGKMTITRRFVKAK